MYGLLRNPSPVNGGLSDPRSSRVIRVVTRACTQLVRRATRITRERSRVNDRLQRLRVLVRVLLRVNRGEVRAYVVKGNRRLRRGTRVLTSKKRRFRGTRYGNVRVKEVDLFCLHPLKDGGFRILYGGKINIVGKRFLRNDVLIVHVRQRVRGGR